MGERSTIKLQIVNTIFSIMPLTRFYRVRTTMLRWAGVRCADSARVVSSARIISTNIRIGKDTFIGHQVLVSGSPDVEIYIGNNVDIAPRVTILSGTHEIDMVNPHSAGRGCGLPVSIGDGVWIGANSTILPGVSIGEKAVIGAGSVVTHDIPPLCIAFGNPASVVKEWDPLEEVFHATRDQL